MEGYRNLCSGPFFIISRNNRKSNKMWSFKGQNILIFLYFWRFWIRQYRNCWIIQYHPKKGEEDRTPVIYYLQYRRKRPWWRWGRGQRWAGRRSSPASARKSPESPNTECPVFPVQNQCPIFVRKLAYFGRLTLQTNNKNVKKWNPTKECLFYGILFISGIIQPDIRIGHLPLSTRA